MAWEPPMGLAFHSAMNDRLRVDPRQTWISHPSHHCRSLEIIKSYRTCKKTTTRDVQRDWHILDTTIKHQCHHKILWFVRAIIQWYPLAQVWPGFTEDLQALLLGLLVGPGSKHHLDVIVLHAIEPVPRTGSSWEAMAGRAGRVAW